MNAMRCVLAGAVLASGVHADWLLNEYATSLADSGEVDRLYGIQSYQNPSSSVTVKVAGGAVVLAATKIASDGAEGYTANVGLLHPLRPDWSPNDISAMTRISFEFRNSTKITGGFVVSFGSDAYDPANAKAGQVYEAVLDGSADVAAGTAWKTASLEAGDFATARWWTEVPQDYPSFAEILKKVKNVQFAPKTSYSAGGTQNGVACKTCVTPTMSTQTLEIRNVVLAGVDKHPVFNPGMLGCGSESIVLDRLFDDTRNEFGGYWFGFSDMDSTGASLDSSKGSSTFDLSLVAGEIGVVSGAAVLKAGLDKRIGTAWHRYAGWAAIGTKFDEDGMPLVAQKLGGIRFHASATSLPATVEGIAFKVQLQGIADTAAHQAFVPASALLVAGGGDFCARPEDLVQPAYVKEADRVAFDPTMGIRQISWEAKIADDKNPAITTAAVEFAVGDVSLDGASVVGVGRRLARSTLAASYSNGVLAVRGAGDYASLDVLSLDGRRVATLRPEARTSIRLSKGTWILAARKADGSRATRAFTVLDR